MIAIHNANIEVKVSPLGAELQSIYCNSSKTEYLWQGNTAYWGKRSPVLFPIVGSLINNEYTYNDNTYTLPRHGFARELPFELIVHSSNTIVYQLKHSQQSLAIYPFEFVLTITYKLIHNLLSTSYTITNPSNEALYCSIGAHPAFNIPLKGTVPYEAHYIAFDNDTTLERYKLNTAGLVTHNTEHITLHNHKLMLSHQLFEQDAIVLKQLKSNTLHVGNTVNQAGFSFTHTNAPYYGIWSTKQAPFICLEPWAGIADNEAHNNALIHKEGILKIAGNNSYEMGWSMVCH